MNNFVDLESMFDGLFHVTKIEAIIIAISLRQFFCDIFHIYHDFGKHDTCFFYVLAFICILREVKEEIDSA